MVKTAEEKAAAKAAKEAEKAAAKAATDPSATSVTVKYRDHSGEVVERTFSQDVHGENFADLAEEFKTTNAQRIVKDE